MLTKKWIGCVCFLIAVILYICAYTLNGHAFYYDLFIGIASSAVVVLLVSIVELTDMYNKNKKILIKGNNTIYYLIEQNKFNTNDYIHNNKIITEAFYNYFSSEIYKNIVSILYVDENLFIYPNKNKMLKSYKKYLESLINTVKILETSYRIDFNENKIAKIEKNLDTRAAIFAQEMSDRLNEGLKLSDEVITNIKKFNKDSFSKKELKDFDEFVDYISVGFEKLKN
ncbi:MAG: hypothetical protein FWF00_06195 [Endomicrobia bacterium]|nr:hypothetical protein [Endomicrobiia bacterium]MCL2507257.1 hypothetical protein [Endomicrobiia bacterium]